MWAFIPCELCSEGEWALPVAILEVSAWVGGFKSLLCAEKFSNSEAVPWLPSAFRIKIKIAPDGL